MSINCRFLSPHHPRPPRTGEDQYAGKLKVGGLPNSTGRMWASRLSHFTSCLNSASVLFTSAALLFPPLSLSSLHLSLSLTFLLSSSEFHFPAWPSAGRHSVSCCHLFSCQFHLDYFLALKLLFVNVCWLGKWEVIVKRFEEPWRSPPAKKKRKSQLKCSPSSILNILLWHIYYTFSTPHPLLVTQGF